MNNLLVCVTVFSFRIQNNLQRPIDVQRKRKIDDWNIIIFMINLKKLVHL